MDTFTISIQHRANIRERWTGVLTYLLNDPRVKVAYDFKGDLWESAKQALTSYGRDDTHVLVLQDDILPCRDFIPTVERILDLLPNQIISFFSNRDLILYAKNQGAHWVKLKKLLMAQAYVMPVAMIEDFMSYAEAHIKPDIYFDDNRISCWMYQRNIMAWATAPSLVEHLGWAESTLTGYKPGHTFEPRLRMAADYIGFENSGLSIDWTKGLDKPVEDNERIIGDFSQYII